MDKSLNLISGLGAGAALMFLLDPDRGARRRALARGKAVAVRHRVADTAAVTIEDARNRAYGTLAEARRFFRADPVSDSMLEERVRSRLGLTCSRPADVHVEARDGRITLRGAASAREIGGIVRRVKWIPGVVGVDNQLTATADDATKGAAPAMRRNFLFRAARTPTDRALALGAALAVLGYGFAHRSRLGSFLGASGLTAAQAVGRHPRGGGRRRWR